MTIDPRLLFASDGAEGISYSLPGTVADDIRTKLSSPYGIYVNPYSGYIYATDANGDFNSPGRLHQWTPTGEYINNYKIYINPAHFLALGDWVPGAVDDITCPAIRNARSFNLQGIAVGQDGKGVIISRGKKYLRK